MSQKTSRTSSPSSPPQPQHAPSKLPRFLQKSSRDRSKSINDPNSPNSPYSSPSSSPSPEVHSTPNPGKTPRKGSKFLGRQSSNEVSPDPDTMDEPPVIVEPVSIPRPRTRSERPINSAPDSVYSSTPSRIGDLPTRLSGWFSHTFSTSSTDLSLPTLLATHASPKSKAGGPSALLTAAKHGKGHLDKAVRYLLDSDSTPDKCSDPIWLLGVQHPGYEPSNVTTPSNTSPPSSFPGRRNSGSPQSFRSSTSSLGSVASSSNEHALLSQSTGANHKNNPAANWPPVFYIDFTSRVWLTYRAQFPIPIKDGKLADLCAGDVQSDASSTTTKKSPWHWVGGEKTWSSDSGWGCMLRTGQSLLANALIHVHLGREWRKPPYPVLTGDYATYVHILTWFLDTPAPEAPFSVHRMALAGKDLGTDVGQWFGPSVAAGAIKTLVNSYPDAGLGVAVAIDGVLYQTDVHAASHGDHLGRTPRRHKRSWGDRPVLLLLGIRLGIEGVNPIYYDTIKMLYTFPQSVGIAGGRPSSSYYFVGSQADNLFYLDPHHARPAIPLRPAPPGPFPFPRDSASDSDGSNRQKHSKTSPKSGHHRRLPTSPSSSRTGSSTFSYHAPVSPSPLQQQFSTSSGDTSSTMDSSDAEFHVPSRSPPAPASSSYHNHPQQQFPPHPQHGRWRSASQPASPGVSELDHREFGMADLAKGVGDGDRGLNSIQVHYCNAYSAAELKTFHCDRVRKMPLSGLDPSMLLGFLCRDEAEWLDLRKRVSQLPRTIFSIQDEPPSWPSDSEDDMGLESISEPDEFDIDDEDGEKIERVEGDEEDLEDDDDEGSEERFFDTRSASLSQSSSASSTSGASQGDLHHQRQRQGTREGDGSSDDKRSKSEDNDTEEDPVDPITPGPHSRFAIIDLETVKRDVAADEARMKGNVVGYSDEEEGEGRGVLPESDDIEDDWIEPSLPTPMPDRYGRVRVEDDGVPPVPPKDEREAGSSREVQGGSGGIKAGPVAKSKSSTNGSSKKTKSRSGKKQVPVPVPIVRIPSSKSQQQQQQEHYPFPVTPAVGGEEEEDEESEHSHLNSLEERQRSVSIRGKRMHTARARDGGRTQSGGVKGILAEDLS
ncbi:hypothetical protein FA15DRAFT_755366 [Coprinopsis marcescibilis]|nr:hypothetical protein FA15DRAFT_755366 [Coprinopsis marcescibilis]